MFVLNYFFCVFLFISRTNSMYIQRINDAQLVPQINTNYHIITNSTCEKCLCQLISSFTALNCFPNNTCQLFQSISQYSKIQISLQTRFYFRPISTPGFCLSSNISLLINKIENGTRISIPEINFQQFIEDNQSFLVTINVDTFELIRYSTENLTMIDNMTFDQSPVAIGFANDAYFIVLTNGSIIIVDSYNLTVLSTMDFENVNGTGDIMFLENGEIMVITCPNENLILFFQQMDISPLNYTFAYSLTTNYSNPQTLKYVNNSFFHVIPLMSNTIYSYAAIDNGTEWIENIFLDLTLTTDNSTVTSMIIDRYGRYWIAFDSPTILIFDEKGHEIGNLTIPNANIANIFMTNNSVMYFSDRQANETQTIRLDPHIGC